VPGNFLNVAGIDLSVLPGGGRRGDTVRGEAVRAFDNTLQDGTDSQKGAWGFSLYPMSPESAATLRAAVSSGPVACYGRRLLIPLVANAILCKVTIEGEDDGPDVSGPTDDWTDFNVSLSILIEEK
jgi:hypothetical protein